MQKISEILRTVSEKTALPTNQPTNQPIITKTQILQDLADAGPINVSSRSQTFSSQLTFTCLKSTIETLEKL